MTRDRLNAMVPAERRDTPKPVKAAKSVKVKVAGNWQVSNEGKVWDQGETATVPAEVADEWERAGLVGRQENVPAGGGRVERPQRTQGSARRA